MVVSLCPNFCRDLFFFTLFNCYFYISSVFMFISYSFIPLVFSHSFHPPFSRYFCSYFYHHSVFFNIAVCQIRFTTAFFSYCQYAEPKTSPFFSSRIMVFRLLFNTPSSSSSLNWKLFIFPYLVCLFCLFSLSSLFSFFLITK